MRETLGYIIYIDTDQFHRKGKNEGENYAMCTGEDVWTERQCQNWFAKFRSGNFNLENAPRSEKPLEADVDKIKSLFDANRRITTRENAARLNLSNATIHKHMKRLRLICKLPHVLTERNLFVALTTAISLLDVKQMIHF